ncbi:MAG: hypothetical protein ABJC89_25315 [Acidobacteriota bacterium]
MTHRAVRPGLAGVLALTALLALAPRGEAAQRVPAPSPGHPVSAEQGQAAPAPVIMTDDSDAQQTRERLNQLFEKYPPALGRVLKLDPSLLGNPSYLTPYPGLAAFLAQHPEVAHNPAYFLERVNVPSERTFEDPQQERRRMTNDLIGGFAMFLVFLVVTGVLVWLIRLGVTNRRWTRLSKVQFEVHSKLLDRFTSSEELLAYVQTPAGRKFLESAPIPLQDETPAMGAPFSRILWSVQAGVVLAIAGAGVLYVSSRFVDEAAQFFMVVGVVTLALGAGFIVSAVAAYVLSRRLGLLERPATDHA